METLIKEQQAGSAVDSLLGIQSRFPLRKATSNIVSAGWGIIAEKRIQASEEIFRVTQPLVNVTSDGHIDDTCDNCLLWTGSELRKETNPAINLTMSKCNACKVVSYCSKQCQKKAWKRHHKAECKLYGSQRSEVIPHTFRATMRLLHQRLSGQLTENQWSALLSLKAHKDKLKLIDDGYFWSLVEEQCQNIKEWTNQNVQVNIIEDIFCIFVINSMSIESPEGQGTIIGSSLDPFAALMNHSCDPNSALFFEGPELRVRSRMTIAPGEEIAISYTDPNDSFEFRQVQLASKYYFTCKCQKCEKGMCRPGDLITGDNALDKSIKEAQRQLRGLLNSNFDAQPIESIEVVSRRICAEGYPDKPWPCDISPTPYLQILLAQSYQVRENWPKTFAFRLKISFETDPLIWPSQDSPRRVENFMRYIQTELQIVNLLSEGDSSVEILRPFESEITKLQYPHTKRFTEDAQRAFGKDSTMAQAAIKWEHRWDVMFGMKAEAIASYCASNEGKLEMRMFEMKLLKWAQNFES